MLSRGRTRSEKRHGWTVKFGELVVLRLLPILHGGRKLLTCLCSCESLDAESEPLLQLVPSAKGIVGTRLTDSRETRCG